METKLYNQDGKEVGNIALPDAVFNAKRNDRLLQQVVLAMQSNARQSTAHTKDRREVSGGGKKPWKQKGTGRARHGSIRSPLWKGGGTTFGPRHERNYEQKASKKMRARALAVALSEKFRHGELFFVDSLAPAGAKTKSAKAIISRLGAIPGAEKLAKRKQNALYISLPGSDAAVERSFRNIGSVEVAEVRNMNPVDALRYKYVAIVRPADALKILEKRVSARNK